MDIEYKDWLDPTSSHGKATIARAAIALANHGGGYIVLGFVDDGPSLRSHPRPDSLKPIDQDQANAAVQRYADPEFHVQLYTLVHPVTGVQHPVVFVPGGHREPVMSKRDCEGVIGQHRCYIRKPGPRSEEPKTREEWRALLHRCVMAQREDMLDAIRAIVTGRVDAGPAVPSAEERFAAFVAGAQKRWAELVADLRPDMPARFPHGYYEMAFALEGAEPAAGLADLQERLAVARRVKLTGWSTFLEMHQRGLAPYAHDDAVEAWVGRPVRHDAGQESPSHCDFWRASRYGQLYTIRGYKEDGHDRFPPGTAFDLTMPIWRVGEGLLFAGRLAEAFAGVDRISIFCRFTGLQGRELVSIGDTRHVRDGRVSHTNEIVLRGAATPEQVRDNLAEVLTPLLRPLYELFDFFPLPPAMVGEESQRLQHGRF